MMCLFCALRATPTRAGQLVHASLLPVQPYSDALQYCLLSAVPYSVGVEATPCSLVQWRPADHSSQRQQQHGVTASTQLFHADPYSVAHQYPFSCPVWSSCGVRAAFCCFGVQHAVGCGQPVQDLHASPRLSALSVRTSIHLSRRLWKIRKIAQGLRLAQLKWVQPEGPPLFSDCQCGGCAHIACALNFLIRLWRRVLWALLAAGGWCLGVLFSDRRCGRIACIACALIISLFDELWRRMFDCFPASGGERMEAASLTFMQHCVAAWWLVSLFSSKLAVVHCCARPPARL